jgi:hypothetical protein
MKTSPIASENIGVVFKMNAPSFVQNGLPQGVLGDGHCSTIHATLNNSIT